MTPEAKEGKEAEQAEQAQPADRALAAEQALAARCALLEQVRFVRALPARLRRALASCASVRAVRALEPMAEQGVAERKLQFLLRGRVLLTRNQLNDLAQSLRFIIDEGRSGMLGGDAMFDRLQTVAAHLARDPEALRQRGLESLGGVLGEYLDDLPYVSEVATMDRNSWRTMGGGAQTEFLDKLESRLRLYQDFNRTPELWKAFDGGRDPGEAVYPVPLSALP